MARIWTSGFEVNSATTNVEWGTGGTPAIATTPVRTGSRSAQISSLSSGTAKHFSAGFDVSGSGRNVVFARGYINITTLPSAANTIFSLRDTNAGVTRVGLKLNADGTLQLFDEDGNVGSPSSALSTGKWYKIEIKLDKSGAGGSHVVEGKLDGFVFATASNRNVSVAGDTLRIGGNIGSETQTQGEWYFDDIAVNDNNGSFQTSYPLDSKIILLTPNAAGDANAWLTTAGGAGDANNYTLVDEVPPNDATDFVQSVTADAIDMYNFSASGLNPTDVVNLVEIFVRFRNGTTDATTSFRVRIEKTSGGTVSESASIVPNTTAWKRNGVTVNTSPLTLYVDPDSAVWTKTTLDSIQAGLKLIAAGTNAIQVSALYVQVDYIPAGWQIFGDEQFIS